MQLPPEGQKRALERGEEPVRRGSKGLPSVGESVLCSDRSGWLRSLTRAQLSPQ